MNELRAGIDVGSTTVKLVILDENNKLLYRDKKRARYYKYDTEQIWGLAQNYHVTLDSSWLGIEHSAEVLCEGYKTH